MSTLALLAPGLKAVTWAWFSFKAIKLACKLGKSINLVAKKGHQPLPRFQSGKVEKFYKGKSKSKRSRPRFSKNKDKLAARKMETSVENKMSECHKPLMEEAEEDRIIKSMIITNFSGCNDNCDCNNVTGDAVPEDLTTIAEDAKELDSKYTSVKERNYTTINDSLDTSGEESQYILEPALKDILETPVKHGNNRREFETLRNSTPATFPEKKCQFDLSFKIPKAQPPKSKLMKKPHALRLLEEVIEPSSNDSYSDGESHVTEDDVGLIDNQEVSDEVAMPTLSSRASTLLHIKSPPSPHIRKPGLYKIKSGTDVDFCDIVYNKLVKSTKRNISVDLDNVLDVYKHSKDILKTGGSINTTDGTLKQTAAREVLDSSALEAAGEMEVDVVEACILVECTTPLPVWTKVSDSGIPSWNKQLLPMDEQALENPVIPPKVDLSLMRYLDNFEKEELKPKTIETAEMADDVNISLGVSYDLISVDSTGEVQTDDDSGETVENSTAMSICSLNQSQSEGVMSGSLVSPSTLGSPDTSSNEGTPCSSRGARSKKISQKIVPVQIKEILKSTDEGFQVEGMDVGIVIIAGRVVSITRSATNTTFIVDDQSGQIEVVQWTDKDSRQKEAWSKGSLIKVFGNVRSRRDQVKKYVMAFKIGGIPTEAEMKAHLLDIVHSHLKIKQLNNQVGGGLSNSMVGFSQTGGQVTGSGTSQSFSYSK